MRTYIAFYNRRKIIVHADSTYEAQKKAAEYFKIKKKYRDVTVTLADVPVDTSTL